MWIDESSNNWYTMTASQEVASDNTSNLLVERRDASVSPTACLFTNQQLIRQQLISRLTLAMAAEQLTFTTAPERQDEHLLVERCDASVSHMAWLSTNQQLIRRLTFTTSAVRLTFTAVRLTFTIATERQDKHDYQAARRPHTRTCPCSCTNCLTAPTPGHGKGRTDSNCLTALEMLQLGDRCSLQYRGNQAENNNTSVPSVTRRLRMHAPCQIHGD